MGCGEVDPPNRRPFSLVFPTYRTQYHHSNVALKLIQHCYFIMKNITLTAVAAVALSGCAQLKNEIVPRHQSTSKYSKYSCAQLELEEKRVNRELLSYTPEQDKLANRDSNLALASMFIVTAPVSLFMSGGNGPLAEEIADLRGQLVAMEKASILKNCRIQFKE